MRRLLFCSGVPFVDDHVGDRLPVLNIGVDFAVGEGQQGFLCFFGVVANDQSKNRLLHVGPNWCGLTQQQVRAAAQAVPRIRQGKRIRIHQPLWATAPTHLYNLTL